MTKWEQKIFQRFSIFCLVFTVVNWGLNYFLGTLTTLDIVGGFTNYVSLFSVTWIVLQRPNQIMYMNWRV